MLLTVGFRGAASKASVGGWAEKAPGQLRCEPGPRFWVGRGPRGRQRWECSEAVRKKSGFHVEIRGSKLGS